MRNQSADLCVPSPSACWSSVGWRWRRASCRPLILAFFSFSTMTKREYIFPSNISLSSTCCPSLVRTIHKWICKNIYPSVWTPTCTWKHMCTRKNRRTDACFEMVFLFVFSGSHLLRAVMLMPPPFGDISNAYPPSLTMLHSLAN